MNVLVTWKCHLKKWILRLNNCSMAIQENSFSDSIESHNLTQQNPNDSQQHFVIKDIETNIPPPLVASTDLDLDKTSFEEYKSRVQEYKSWMLTSKFERLDLEIKPLISRINGVWTCQVCGKQSGANHRGHISSHVESRHMDISLYCTKFGHISKSRDALRMHCTKYCK